MPHFWNNSDILVVTKEELEPWYSCESLKKAIQRYSDKTYGIKRACRACRNQPLLVLFDSLEAQIQQALGDPRKCDHILERYYKVDGEAVRFFKTFKFEDQSYLDTEYQERYIINASVIKAVLKLRAERITIRKNLSGPLTGIGQTLCSDAHSFQATLLAKHKVQHTLPENYRRFMQAIDEFESIGFDSLISGNHKNQKARKVTDQTIELIQNMFATDKQKPTATEVHRRYDAFINGYLEVMNNDTAELYNPKDYKKLSDATVKNYLAKWEIKIGTHAVRSGDRQKYMQQFKTYHSLDKPKYAGSIISIDDRQPPFETLSGNRVWFYNGIDLGAEAFTCWVHGDTKEGIIMDFYRQMVRNYAEWGFNLPAELEAEMSLNSSYVNTFLREGEMFQYVRIEANNARGKRIERYFGNLRYGLEKEREGWLARPFALSESNQKGAKQVPQLPYSTIIENALADIETWNNQPHSVHTHMSRWQVFCEMQNPKTLPTNYIAILPHIGFKTVSSCRVGIIKLQSKEFLLGNDGKIALGQSLINLMKQVEGKEVNIYWLDDNEGRVLKAMVFIGTQFICEAIPKPTYQKARIEQTEHDNANRVLMSAYVATIESFGRRQKQQIEPVTLIKNIEPVKKTFIMRGIPQHIQKTEDRETEVLPEIPVGNYMPARKALKDRF
jgi:hypothetical protein